MGNDVGLNADRLLDAAKKMEEAANRIDASIAKIDNAMSNLDAVWNDVNSKRYLAKYEDLKHEFPDFKAAVHEYSEFLIKVVDTYNKEFIEATSGSVE